MATAAARSEKKRVYCEVLHNLSAADICMLFVIPQDIGQFNEREAERNYLLRDRSLFSGGGGGGYYIWGEGHYFFSLTLGRAIFKKMPFRGGLQFF